MQVVDFQKVVIYLLMGSVPVWIISRLMSRESVPEWMQTYSSAIAQGALNMVISAAAIFLLFCI